MLTCSCHSHNGFLTKKGLAMVEKLALDKTAVATYIDRVRSVSALPESEGGCGHENQFYFSLNEELTDGSS